MMHRSGARPPRRIGVLAAALLMASSLAGCLTADGELASDGTGKLTVTYTARPGATESSERVQFEAPGITVESITLVGSTVNARLTVSDLAALSKTKLFKDTTVVLAADGAAKKLTITSRTPQNVKKPKDGSVPGPKVRLTMPGKVIEANQQGAVDGKTVVWSFPLIDWLGKPLQELVVRFETPAATDQPAPKAD